MFGFAGQVDGIVERMRAELGGDAATVATGGLAELIVPAHAHAGPARARSDAGRAPPRLAAEPLGAFMDEAARILVYGLFAAASPTTLLATLVVLGSKSGRAERRRVHAGVRPRHDVAFVLALTLGQAVTSNDKHENSNVATLLELLAGLALLAIAMRTRPPHTPQEPDPDSRTELLFARLARVRAATAFGIGLPLGVGAKRLTITLLAAGTVSLSSVGSAGRLTLSVLYIAVASVVVWLPVLIYLILGARADDIVASTRAWITRNQQRFTFLSVTVLGVLLVGDALS